MNTPRTPEEIAESVLRKNGTTNRILPAIEEARGLMIEAAREAQAAPAFKPEGEPDKYRDLYNANMPRVSGCMWFAIPGEQPIIVDDDQALRFLQMLSSEDVDQ